MIEDPQTETVQRWDAGRLRKAHRTDEGFLFADGFATRTGVLTYHLPDGSTRRELRHPDEVGHADSLASLGRKPVTLGHPPEMVSPENAEAHQVGTVGEEVTFNKADGFVRVTMALHRQDAIQAVDRGIRELSTGYRVTLVHEPGTFEGQAFDARQTQIRYNHLSIEGQGRAGPSVRLRLDGAGVEVQPVRETMSDRASVEIGGVRYDTDPGLAQAVTTALQAGRQDAAGQKARADQAETDLGTTKA
jgi:hypothetical protein